MSNPAAMPSFDWSDYKRLEDRLYALEDGGGDDDPELQNFIETLLAEQYKPDQAIGGGDVRSMLKNMLGVKDSQSGGSESLRAKAKQMLRQSIKQRMSNKEMQNYTHNFFDENGKMLDTPKYKQKALEAQAPKQGVSLEPLNQTILPASEKPQPSVMPTGVKKQGLFA